MAMSLIADEEDYENSDAEQVAMLSWTYLDLKTGDAIWLHAAVILCCVYLHV